VKKIFLAFLFALGGLALALAGAVPAHALGEYGPQADQVQNAINSNQTEQKASADAYTKQTNVNLPISVLSFDANNGNVYQSNQADTQANAKNSNATDQGIAQEQNGNSNGYSPDGGQNQFAKNENGTEQHAYSDATTKQVNVNAPISILSAYSNNGNVDQSNQADTQANAKNSNGTEQGIWQSQKDSGSGQGYSSDGYNRDGEHNQGQDQFAKNDNSTEQKSSADATTKQVNVNAPVSILSFGANNGDVNQSNQADTQANARNDNWTGQSIDQNQSAKSEHHKPSCNDGKKGEDYGRSNKDNRSGSQDQFAKNDNYTKQKSSADAYTQQKNFNAPFSFLSFGANNGNVHQHNNADTIAHASNSNSTGQWIGQLQHT